MLQFNQKTFLLTGVVFLFLISVTLFSLHDRALDPKQTGDWWAIRFATFDNPQNLGFEVENHSPITTGSYQVFIDGKPQEERALSVPTDAVTSVTPDVSNKDSSRIRIVVKLGDKEQSLTR